MVQLEIEGYPTEMNPDFKEPNINDLIIFTLHPIFRYFRRETGRDLRLRREKVIVLVDSETGGMDGGIRCYGSDFSERRKVRVGSS